jgi:hypothetical protein
MCGMGEHGNLAVNWQQGQPIKVLVFRRKFLNFSESGYFSGVQINQLWI